MINVFEKGNRHLLEAAVKLMLETYNFVCRLLKLDKFKTAVHCGNLKKHGKMVYDLLKVNGKKPLLMVEGKQGEYIERFIKGDYDFFCGVALEYGYDWSFIPCQFIVKMPFPDLEDARVQGIRETLGEEKFKEWYSWEAMSRVIQASGRNARNPRDFAVTVILDSNFTWVFKKYKDKVPEWFKKRVVFAV